MSNLIELCGNSEVLKELILSGQINNIEPFPQKKYVGVGKRGYIPFTDYELEYNFWSRVNVVEHGCWEWKASKKTRNYGGVNWRWPDRFGCPGKKEQTASRVSWILTSGPITSEQFVLHKCDNPPCCRPDHLFLGDNRLNTDDKVSKNRHWWPLSINARTRKLTEDQVREIRRRSAEPRGDLAREFSVTGANIKAIVQRETWKNLQ